MAVIDERLVVFAQGMRRSGTTIVFDLMLEEGSYECFYEPLARAVVAMGGGSGVHGDRDLFQSVRAAREAFLSANPEWLARCPDFREMNLLNYGAPRLAELEFEPDLPRYCRDYISFLASRAPRTFLKFTRMHSKVHCLKEIEPNAKFIHIVRDPRQVVASYLFGKDRKYKDRFKSPRDFFDRVSSATAWSSGPFSDYILGLDRYKLSGRIEDFVRVLLIWKYKFERTDHAGRAAFGRDYLLLRHEDLLATPADTIARLGTFLGKPLSERAIDWARANMKALEPPYAAGDARWREAFERLGMMEMLSRAGYHDT